MITLCLTAMAVTLVVTGICFWITTWSKNQFNNANLELIGKFSAAGFMFALGMLIPVLSFEYMSYLFDDDVFITSAMKMMSVVVAFNFFLSGVSMIYQQVRELVSDFHWAFNKKKHDEKPAYKRTVKKNRNRS